MATITKYVICVEEDEYISYIHGTLKCNEVVWILQLRHALYRYHGSHPGLKLMHYAHERVSK